MAKTFKPKGKVTKVSTGYKPQPKQEELHKCKATEILFGGAAGGGKSFALRMDALDWCTRIPGLQVYLFRRTFPELEKNHILCSMAEFPKEVGKFNKQDRRWTFINGSMLHFCHCQYEHDVFDYQGAEFHILYIDEVSSFTAFQYEYLSGRVRCTLDIPKVFRDWIPRIVCASNPGGIGHVHCKKRWVDFAKPMEVKKATQKDGGMTRCYIPSRLEDNKKLMQCDPGYINRLDALPEPYRTAYKTGDWNIFMGQAFKFTRETHVIKPLPIPDNAPIYMTYDWGFGAPFSILWWWVDNDNRLYCFDEWYGWNGEINKGLRMEDSDVAKGVKEREEMAGISKRYITRVASPDCFNKKPDYRGGGQGPSTAEVFAGQGLYLTPGDASRKLKIRQFRERLKTYSDMMPMMVVYENCENFIRTIPFIQTDPKNVEEVDTNGEDHVFDSAALMAMYRPISQPDIETPVFGSAKIIDMIEKKGDNYADRYEHELMRDFMDESDDYGYGYRRNEYDTGVNYATV